MVDLYENRSGSAGKTLSAPRCATSSVTLPATGQDLDSTKQTKIHRRPFPEATANQAWQMFGMDLPGLKVSLVIISYI
jgi:hypothetical protein